MRFVTALVTAATLLAVATPTPAGAAATPRVTWPAAAGSAVGAGTELRIAVRGVSSTRPAVVRLLRVDRGGRTLRVEAAKRLRRNGSVELPLSKTRRARYRVTVTVGARRWSRRFVTADACALPGASEDPAPVGRLTLDRTTVARGQSVVATLHNTGSTCMTTGVDYVLERSTGSGWEPAPGLRAFPAIGVAISPGESHAVTVPIEPGFPPGRYRVTRRWGGADTPSSAYAEFDVT